MRKLNNTYGVPIFNDQEQALLHSILVSVPCKVCKAKRGDRCMSGLWDGEKMVYGKNKGNKLAAGRVHMGRLPHDFDSEVAVDAALAKLKTL